MAGAGDAGALIACGRVGRPHGVRGELRIWPLNPDTELLVKGRRVALGHDARGSTAFDLVDVRHDAKGFVVRLRGVEDREAAARWTGATWFEPRDAFPEPDDDEVYIADLIGLAVRTEAGEPVGVITDVWEAGAGDLLVIRGPRGEHLVPNIDDFVVRLDPAAGEAIIRPIEGLLEVGEE